MDGFISTEEAISCFAGAAVSSLRGLMYVGSANVVNNVTGGAAVLTTSQTLMSHTGVA